MKLSEFQNYTGNKTKLVCVNILFRYFSSQTQAELKELKETLMKQQQYPFFSYRYVCTFPIRCNEVFCLVFQKLRGHDTKAFKNQQ